MIIRILLIIILAFTIIYFVLNSEHKTLDEASRFSTQADFIALKQGYVHYELSGESGNPLVVLIHGFSTPAYMWDRNVKALTDSGFQVLRFDLYGRGLSDRPRVDYDLDLFVDQTDELLEALKVDYPIHIVGLSMGGPIAAAYTDRHSTHVRSLTLIDPVVSNIFEKTAFPMNVRGLGEFVMTYIMMPFILPKAQCDDFYHPEAFPDWEARFQEQMQYKGFRRAILSTMRCMSHEDMLPIYRNIGEMNIPTLIFHGDEDATISVNDIELLRSLVPQNHFYAIPEAGHIPQYEQAEKVNPILIDFFQANDQKTTGD